MPDHKQMSQMYTLMKKIGNSVLAYDSSVFLCLLSQIFFLSTIRNNFFLNILAKVDG